MKRGGPSGRSLRGELDGVEGASHRVGPAPVLPGHPFLPSSCKELQDLHLSLHCWEQGGHHGCDGAS